MERPLPCPPFFIWSVRSGLLSFYIIAIFCGTLFSVMPPFVAHVSFELVLAFFFFLLQVRGPPVCPHRLPARVCVCVRVCGRGAREYI